MKIFCILILTSVIFIAADTAMKTRPYFTKKMRNLIVQPGGTSITLECFGKGNPTPEIRWQKNGQIPHRELKKKIVYRKYTLHMDDLNRSDSGIYECILINSEGSVNWTYELEVYDRIIEKPIFKDGYLMNQTVYAGGRAVFECRFFSDLQPRMRWLRHYSINDSETPYVTLDSTDPHILVIDNVTEKDESWYTCIVGNLLGVSYRSAYLTVLPSPETSSGNRKDSPHLFIYTFFMYLFSTILLFK